MSRDTGALGAGPFSEMVGFNGISLKLSLVLRECAAQESYQGTLPMAYETAALVHASQHMAVCCTTSASFDLGRDGFRVEMDDASPFERARSNIYPQLA
jgi:hypothetical protein